MENMIKKLCFNLQAKLGDKNEGVQAKRCVHFYACICAFASDEKLTGEFQYYISLNQGDLGVERPLNTVFPNDNDKLVAIGDENKIY